MAEWLGSSIPGHANYVVSLGKALNPTCLGENVPVLTVSRSGYERLLND